MVKNGKTDQPLGEGRRCRKFREGSAKLEVGDMLGDTILTYDAPRWLEDDEVGRLIKHR